jgi:cytosine/adenosine deaminase-related metal-dependent hydrolase
MQILPSGLGREEVLQRSLQVNRAKLLNFKEYGFAVGHPADVVIINAQSPEQAIAEISQPIAALKKGKRTVLWDPPKLLRPPCSS